MTGGWITLLGTPRSSGNGRLRRLPDSVRLALPILVAALQLAGPIPTTAAPLVSSGSGSNVPAVGQVKATLLVASSHQAKAKASPALPAKFMHPRELQAAKLKAASGSRPAPTQPAAPIAAPAAALFNGLYQPALSPAGGGSGAPPRDSPGATGPTR